MTATNLHLLIGEDDYRADEKAREIIAECLAPDEREFGLDIADARGANAEEAARAVRQCVESLRTLGFFGNRKVVWLRHADLFRDSLAGKTEVVKAAVQELTETVKAGLPAEQVLIVSAPKMDKRQSFFRACQGAKAQICGFSVSEKNWEALKQAGEQLRRFLAKSGLRMSGEVEAAFLDKVGTETRRIAAEIEKLDVYLGKRRKVERKDLAEIVCASREASAWDLLDAIGERNVPEALRLLRQALFLGGKESPIGLVHFLAGRIQDWIVFRQALDRGWARSVPGRSLQWGQIPEAALRVLTEDLKKNPLSTHPYRANVLAQQASKYAMSELTQAYRHAVAACEAMMSGGRAAHQALILELLLVRIMARQAEGTGRPATVSVR